MGKKKHTGQDSEGVAAGIAMQINSPIALGRELNRWGYGFERHGAKWRAYKTGAELTYLSPERGEELHSAITKIKTALANEVNKAIRNRGKP